ncbi:MAG: DUF1330 domain-containing protein [Deltaproteobacteria bacterium]|nr:DUF1330 domain-containing protein [Deltaproteobacteria bacterium]MBW2086832.1 DUF1330 domain-containing protein [Deltaproteobacteria bacterium]
MATVEPTGEQLKKFTTLSDEKPVVMINLLKFKPEGGVESYAKYSETSLRLISELGGRILYYGQYEMPLIGNEDWDVVILVEYPSRAAFLKMVQNKEYQAAVHYRREALTDSRLYATKSLNYGA